MRGFNRFGMGSRRFRFTGYDKMVDCPDVGHRIEYSKCLGCDKYREWRNGDAARCWYEFKELKDQGYYKPGQEGWMEYLKNADPDTYERLKEEEESRKGFEEWWKEDQEELESMREDMRSDEEPLEPDVEEEKPWYEEDDSDEDDSDEDDSDEDDALGDFAEEEEDDDDEEEE